MPSPSPGAKRRMGGIDVAGVRSNSERETMKPVLTKLLAILAGAWRFRWQGLAAAWTICLLGWLAVWSIPDRYAVQAIVYIDTGTVLGPLMRGLTVPADQDQQVAIMLRSMATRPNLEQI